MTQGWRADTKTFGGAGFDSDGNYLETYFSLVAIASLVLGDLPVGGLCGVVRPAHSKS
jgi:hypothetical protein